MYSLTGSQEEAIWNNNQIFFLNLCTTLIKIKNTDEKKTNSQDSTFKCVFLFVEKK